MSTEDDTFSNTWLELLCLLFTEGEQVAPRGKATRELLHFQMGVNMRRPVLRVPERRLSYQFMAAEAYWILSGDKSVAGIAPWNSKIAEFSDDGVTFFGAYGPKIVDQLEWVAEKLRSDPLSRQAGLTIWREMPPESKDIPCTIAIWFTVREGVAARCMDTHVFMRSSDVWLGLPYDVFNFSMLTHLLCGLLNDHEIRNRIIATEPLIQPRTLYLTTVSSHLYDINANAARTCIETWSDSAPGTQAVTPPELWRNPYLLMASLMLLRDSKPGHTLRWWETKK